MNTRQLEIITFFTASILLNCVSNVISDDENEIKKCRIDDENCIFDTANVILRNYFKGYDDLSIPPLDPLRIDQLSVIQDLNAVKVDATIRNTDMTGLSKAKLIKLKGFDSGEVEMRFVIPSGGMNGPYKVKGKLLKMSIEGSGQLKLTFINMDIGLKFMLVNKTVDGKTYLHAQKPKMTMTLGGGTANLSHLGSIANSFINWSFVTLINAVKETYCKPMSQVYLDKINSILLKVPYDELFIP